MNVDCSRFAVGITTSAPPYAQIFVSSVSFPCYEKVLRNVLACMIYFVMHCGGRSDTDYPTVNDTFAKVAYGDVSHSSFHSREMINK